MIRTDRKSIYQWMTAAISLSYPILVLSICLWLNSKSPYAGTIRKMALSSEHSGIVTLATGHTTALSFTTKPDRVVVGSPESLHVDFLGNDVIVTPSGREPGNLLIYTKAGRYVVLFRMGSTSNYDDVVEISEGTEKGHARTIHLLQDSYGIEQIQIVIRGQNKTSDNFPSQITAWVSGDGRTLSGEDLSHFIFSMGSLRCGGCLIRKRQNDAGPTLVCTRPVKTLRCQGGEHMDIEIKRSAS